MSNPPPPQPAHTPEKLIEIMGAGGCFFSPAEADSLRHHLAAYRDVVAALTWALEHIARDGGNTRPWTPVGLERLNAARAALAKAEA